MKEELESALKHNCSLLSENKLCVVVNGIPDYFNYKNHSKCEHPNLSSFYGCLKYQKIKNTLTSLKDLSYIPLV